MGKSLQLKTKQQEHIELVVMALNKYDAAPELNSSLAAFMRT